VRDGENVADLRRTCSCQAFDGDLTDLGHRQTLDLAHVLLKQPTSFAAVWGSPF
jgi:broad specificity phosphatase PhoE